MDHWLTLIFPRRWDDWVPQERLRKFTEENKELASNLKKDMDAHRRAASGKPASVSTKKRPFGSDLASSARGSEDRSSAAPQPPRGTKRGREIEGIDKVRLIFYLVRDYAFRRVCFDCGRACCSYTALAN